jgi:hypothetical protein
MSLLDLISKDSILTNTKKVREAFEDTLYGNKNKYTEKGKKIFQAIKAAGFDDIAEGLEKNIYNLVSLLINEPLPLLNTDTPEGDPESNTMIVSTDNNQNSIDSGDIVIFLGDGKVFQNNEEMSDDFDSSESWRYATDEEIGIFFRNN